MEQPGSLQGGGYVPPLPCAHKDLLLPSSVLHMPAYACCTRLAIVQRLPTKDKTSYASCSKLLWHPDGRRVNFGLETGDLSLWMAPAYNFETIFNFSAVRLASMTFSHNQWWLLMGDQDGTLRYLHSYDEIMKGKVHTRAVTDISFSPTDAKFVTCSDDGGLKVFDFDKAGTSIMEKQKTGMFTPKNKTTNP